MYSRGGLHLHTASLGLGWQGEPRTRVGTRFGWSWALFSMNRAEWEFGGLHYGGADLWLDSPQICVGIIPAMRRKRRRHGKPGKASVSSNSGALPQVSAWRSRFQWALALLGKILLTSVGLLGLVALRPQLSAAPLEALEKSQAFSVPFVITNVGLLPIQHVVINCYIRRLLAPGVEVSGEHGVLMGNPDWRFSELGRGESKTLVCPFLISARPPKTADLSFIVEYEAAGVPFHRFRTVFRFVGQDGDTWAWLPQPSSDIRMEIDETIRAIRPRKYS